MAKLDRWNLGLLIAVALLLALSLALHRQAATRADRFERGQKFLPNLNPDEVGRILLRRGGEELELRRQGDRFVLVGRHGYPARNDAVNRLLRDLLEISLDREVGGGESLRRELGLEPPAAETLEVALAGAAGQEMVRFRAAPRGGEAGGAWLERLDRPGGSIFLTSRELSLDPDADAFLETRILDVERSRVRRIEGPDYLLERGEGGELGLSDPTTGRRLARSAAGRLESVLSPLRFERVFLGDDPVVADLEFSRALEVALDDGSGYRLLGAAAGGRRYLRVAGFHTVSQVAITRDESEEELERKAETLRRADEIDDFNAFHGSWVYELGEPAAETLALRRGDLVEAVGPTDGGSR